MNHLFVTGTDTEVGKTYAACALIHALRTRGLAVAAMKPVAAGTDAGGRNDEIERLRAAASVDAPREWVTPYLFAPPIAPHLAAAEAGQRIDLARIGRCFEELAARADAVVVEGVGGFRVPLNEREDTADLAAMLGLPVVLVVGLRLGCLNHALLTAEAIERRGLHFAGWIGNAIDPAMARPEANITALRNRLPAPCLGLLPHDPDGRPESASHLLNAAVTLRR
jgi:dethiobiotin synthetase